MTEQKESAPSGIAGLVRYEEEKSKVQIKPEYVFVAIGIISEVELAIQGLYLVAVAFGVLFGLMVYWLYKNNMLSKPQPGKVQTAVSSPAPQPAQPVQQNSAQQ